MAKHTIYTISRKTGEQEFDGSAPEFEFMGVYPLVMSDLGVIFVPTAKVSKISSQTAGAKMTEVKDLKVVAAIACYMGWEANPSGYSADKVALLKDYGYDLIKEYTDEAGIKKAGQEYIEA